MKSLVYQMKCMHAHACVCVCVCVCVHVYCLCVCLYVCIVCVSVFVCALSVCVCVCVYSMCMMADPASWAGLGLIQGPFPGAWGRAVGRERGRGSRTGAAAACHVSSCACSTGLAPDTGCEFHTEQNQMQRGRGSRRRLARRLVSIKGPEEQGARGEGGNK